MRVTRRNRRHYAVMRRRRKSRRAERRLYRRHEFRARSYVTHGHWTPYRRRSISRRGRRRGDWISWYAIRGRRKRGWGVHCIVWWVRSWRHRIVRSGILSRWREGALQVWSLWMGEDARRTVTAGRVVSARDHASYVRRWKVPKTVAIRVNGVWGWRRIISNCTVGQHWRRDRVIIRARRWGEISLGLLAVWIVEISGVRGGTVGYQ